tara:strand:- start:962 stop:1918 length:957 start_codon:yes stop_codon:yes gene_type:complete
MSWNEYVLTLREARDYRNRIKRLNSDMDDLLAKGPQDPGPPYKKKRKRLPKDINKISAPPGARGGGGVGSAGGALEEEVEAESFDIHETLEPIVWPHGKLDPDVARRLKDIADSFIDNLDVEVGVVDLRFTGSLANYNWSNYSDIDLHIVVDFSKFKSPRDIVKGFFDAKRALWNDLHDIKVHGYEVEIYVEDVNEKHLSSGVYSLTEDEWIVEPVQHEEEVDVATARRKSSNIITRVNLIKRYMMDKDYKKVISSIDSIKDKIRRMRMAGLKSPRSEYSPENIAFKILRREGTLGEINKIKQKAEDKEMSLNGISRD